MKHIAVSQRVDVIEKYNERRDAIDQRWTDLMIACGLWPVLVPNNLKSVDMISIDSGISGFILTGGNSITRYGGNSPERDQVEVLLLEYSIENKLPILGVCRGMQLIQDYFGVTLKPVSGHVAVRHKVEANPESRMYRELAQLSSVNAYHNLGAVSSVKELRISSKSKDGIVMSVEHIKYPIYGQMWHSEREDPFIKAELDLFKKIFY